MWSMPAVDAPDGTTALEEETVYSWEPAASGALGSEPTPTESPDMWGAPLADPLVAEFTDVESSVSTDAAAAPEAEVEATSWESAPEAEAELVSWDRQRPR